jgi:hypothetical protein
MVDSLKALDPERPIREVDISNKVVAATSKCLAKSNKSHLGESNYSCSTRPMLPR